MPAADRNLRRRAGCEGGQWCRCPVVTPCPGAMRTVRADQVQVGEAVAVAGHMSCRQRPRVTRAELVRRDPDRPPEVCLTLSGPPGRLVLARSEAVTVLDTSAP